MPRLCRLPFFASRLDVSHVVVTQGKCVFLQPDGKAAAWRGHGTKIAPMSWFSPRALQREQSHAELAVLGDFSMAWLVRTLRLPAAESHTNLALALCVFLMGLLSVALIWQAQIIANQRDAIRFLETLKFGG